MSKQEIIELLKNCIGEESKEIIFGEAQEEYGSDDDTEAQKWENAFNHLQGCIEYIIKNAF